MILKSWINNIGFSVVSAIIMDIILFSNAGYQATQQSLVDGCRPSNSNNPWPPFWFPLLVFLKLLWMDLEFYWFQLTGRDVRPLHHHLLNMRVFLEYFLDNVNSFWILSEEVFAGLLQIKLVDVMNEMFSEAREICIF